MRSLTSRFLLVSALSLGFGAVCTRAATYLEIGGQVVVEAEHFDSRTVDATDGHHWHVVPDDNTNPLDPLMDNPATYSELIWTNARGGKYIQSFPDSAGGGINKNADPSVVGTDEVANYKMQINTTGQYRLYLRFSGYDGSSDSMYAQIVELIDGLGTGQPDWYRYVGSVVSADFSQIVDTTGGQARGWNGDAAPEGSANQLSGGGGEVAAVWTISTPGIYTVRISQREDGSALDAFVLQLASLPEPDDPGPDESPVVGSQYVRIAQQPKDTTVANNQTATFTVVTASSGSATYQWQKANPGSTNYADITGATSATYTTPAVTAADDGTRYRVIASIPGQSTTSRGARLSVDVTPPTLVRATGSATFDKVVVIFSEPVDPASGTNTGHYSLNGNLTISGATLAAGGTRVILTTSKQTTNANYTLTVSAVTDLVGNLLSPSPSTANFTGWVLNGGGVLHKFFNNVSGNTVANLVGDSRFPDSPSFVTVEPLFEYPPNGGGEAGSNYGNELSGLLTAPLPGNYVFFTCSDDPSQLYLSTDESPANKRLIAVEASWSNARNWNTPGGGTSTIEDKRSDLYAGSQWPTPNVITLTAGNRYYIEVLHTEGGGGDNVGVAWRLPGGTDPIDLDPPIPGSAVSFYYNPDSTVTISQQPQDASVQANTPVTFSVTATGSSGYGNTLYYQWQKSAPGGVNFTNIPGANQAQYSIAFVSAADNQAQFRVTVGALPLAVPIDKGRITSSAATLTVTTDTTPPVVRGALSPDPNTVLVKFTEPVVPGTSANYNIDQGVLINAVAQDTNDAAGLVLTTSAMTVGTRYNLTITGVLDRGANTISPNPTQKQFLSQSYLVGGLPGNAGALPVLPTNEKRALGSLTTRGFLIHVWQNAAYNAADGIARAEDLLAGRLGPNQAPTNTFIETNIINYARPDEIARMVNDGHILNNAPMPVIVPAGLAEDNFAFEILSYVELKAGIYRWGVSSDDGFHVSPAISASDPNNAITLGLFDGGRGIADSVFDFAVFEDGLYPIRLLYEEGGGDANVEWWNISDVSQDDPTTAPLAAINDSVDPTALKAFQPPLVTPAPQITTATISNGNITIQWINGSTLQSTTSLSSPNWQPTAGANGTFTEPAVGTTRFYRVVR